jgi:hypothetical protein
MIGMNNSTPRTTMASSLDILELRRIIEHVFQPRKLLRSSEDSGNTAFITITLEALEAVRPLIDMRTNNKHLEGLYKAITAITHLKSINSLEGGHMDGKALLTTLTSLNDGDTLAARITVQNPGLLITKHNGDLVFEQFELSALNAEVMGTTGRLVHQFAESAIRVPVAQSSESNVARTIADTLTTMCRRDAPGM